MSEERTNTTHTETVKFSPFEDLLAEKFGERFRVYRRDYYKSLNYDKNSFLPDFPLTVTLELVNRCNLDCVMCYTINHAEKKATFDMPRLRGILGECEREGLPALVIGLGSEPLLYKGIRDVLKTSIDSKIMDIFLGTNGVLLNESLSEYLVQNQIARVEISLDAATPETYLKVRRKNELPRIERNIEMLLEIKKKNNSALPVIRLCFCVMDINSHEQETFLKKWEERVDYVDFQKLYDFGSVDELRETGTVAGVEKIEVADTYCAYPFNSLHVWSNGNVTPCCTFFAKNERLVVGNVAEQSLKEIWEGDKIKEIRRQLVTGDLNPTCRVCLAQRDHGSFEEMKKVIREAGYPK
jgi:radical SAM protein with 4Fe4S-binding SPASM domain